jgi:hypothetical protein
MSGDEVDDGEDFDSEDDEEAGAYTRSLFSST